MAKKTEKLWSFFTKNQAVDKVDKKHPKVTCQIKVPAVTGAICGKVLATPDSNTSSLRTHLRSFHPEAAQEVAVFEASWVQKRQTDDKKLEKMSKI
jgi:hypothetical protein